MGIDTAGYLPTFMDMTDGEVHKISWGKETLIPPKKDHVLSLREDSQIMAGIPPS